MKRMMSAVLFGIVLVGFVFVGKPFFVTAWQIDTGTYWKSTSQTVTGSWVNTGSTLPATLYMSQAAVVGDYVYLFGGFGMSATNVIYRAPVSNPTAWVNTGSTLPGNLAYSQLAVIDDYIYLFGGSSNVIYRAPVSNPTAWVNTGSTLPSGLYVSQIAVIGDYVYLFGGRNTGYTNVIYRAPITDPTSWVNTGATLPNNLAYSQVAVIDDYVYLFGGLTAASSPTNAIYRAPITDPTSWTNTGSTLPGALSSSQVAVLDEYVYLFGGLEGSQNVIYRAPVSNPLSWTNTGSTLPGSAAHSQFVAIDNYGYLFGAFLSSVIYRVPLTPGAGQCTWIEQTASGSRNWGDIASSDDGTKLVAGVTDGYNYTSTDSGATWTQRTGPDGQFFTVAIESSADGSKLISGPSEGFPYVSTNSGASWSYGHQIGVKWRDFASSDDGQIVVAGTMTYLYTSTNAGTTFTSRTGPGQRWWAGVDTSSDGTKQVAAARTNATGGTGRLYRSIDSGVNWSQLGGAGLRDYSDIASSADGTQLVATAYGGYIYTSTDSGVNWTEHTSPGSQQWENVDMSSDGMVIVATVDVGYIYISLDGGTTWDAQTAAGSRDWGEIIMSPDGTKIAAAVYGGYVYTSTCAPLNTAPNAPTVTATSTGYANVPDTFSFSDSIDPEGDTIRYVIDWNNDGNVDEYAPAAGYIASGASVSTSYAWSTSGTKDYQVAAEDNSAARSAWTPKTITIAAAPTALLTASTTSYRTGDPAVGLEWSSSGATSCTGTNFSTGGATSGWTSVTPTATTTYTVDCTGPGGNGSDDVTINYSTNQSPAAPSITGPTVGRTGVTYTFTITSTDPEGDPVQNGIDCDNDGSVDTWGATTTSGTPQLLSCSFSSEGTYSVRGISLDSRGALSSFSSTPVSINIAPACDDCYPLMGYGWSENVGWISLNCENTASCGETDYYVEANVQGVLSGYAWGDNVGWISANQSDVAACPSGGTCTARIDPANGYFLGWMKALAADSAENGGWDGWISLSCLNLGTCGVSSYGPIVNFLTNAISGFAWGDMVAGWIDFQYASTTFEPLIPDTYSCLDADTLRYIAPDYSITDTLCPFAAYGYGCIEQGGSAVCLTPPTPAPDGEEGNLTVTPSLVHYGDTATVSWDIENATSCTVTGDNGDSWSGISGSEISSGIVEATLYTLHCESGVPGFTYDDTAQVNIAPIWQEI